MPKQDGRPDDARLDRIVAEARRAREARAKGYREQALKLFPWVCGRCGREFTHANLQLLEVHHKDQNHDNNPPDGSNWELLCTYCHENEHQRYITEHGRDPEEPGTRPPPATHQPFADLKARLGRRK
ncbi:MAG: YajD family HNH nuclease [Burkholderiales bacterium]|nr:YajD family HNH nuclease [Burkholderiales bacterium]